MGRPIKAVYFGSPKGTGSAGESVASVTVGGANNDYLDIPVLTVAAPTQPGVTAVVQVASVGVHTIVIDSGGQGYVQGDVLTLQGLGTGIRATLTVTSVDDIEGDVQVITGVTITTAGQYTSVTDLTELNTTGGAGTGATFSVTRLKINSVTVVTPGSGYLTAPEITSDPTGAATLTAVLTDANATALLATAHVPGAASAVAADIVSQKGARRYKVTTSQGTGVCKLVTSEPDEGEMRIVAVDSDGGTYFVKKLSNRTAILEPDTGLQFASGARVKWTLGAAEEDVKVTIQNA
jgi:hypothetical protein